MNNGNCRSSTTTNNITSTRSKSPRIRIRRNDYLLLYLMAAILVVVVICNIISAIFLHTTSTSTSTLLHHNTPGDGSFFFPIINNNNNDQNQQQLDLEKSNLYAFTIRDSVRLSPTLLPSDIHIFDYVDINNQNQQSNNQQLFLDGILQSNGKIPCHNYTVQCYHLKIIQTFQIVMKETTSNNVHAPDYIFYMESDNDLCLPMKKIATLANKYQRYFISTGIGASGWIMSKQFLQDFIQSEYFTNPHSPTIEDGPDIFVAQWLRSTRQWSVTRQYFVQHSIISTTQQSQNQKGLTVNSNTNEFEIKHLPRCFEPHRGMWIRSKLEQIQRDKFGWDYFDYKKCPTEEIFPCTSDGVSQIPIHRPLLIQQSQQGHGFNGNGNSKMKIKGKKINNNNNDPNNK